MKNLLAIPALLAFSVALTAEVNDPIPLWPAGAPGALGTEDKDIPTITPYLPEGSKSGDPIPAIVVCPGGGYGGLAPHEGKDYALWLNDLRVAAFVLKYRLGSSGYRHPVMLNDAARAVRLVRARADDWKVDPKHVGIMGSSAGGHLASTLLTHFDAGKADAEDPVERQSSRPDWGILCYAVITMGQFTHQGSKNNLLGKNPSPELVKLLSNELQVTKETPPCFVWHTYEDTAVPVENSLLFAEALRKAGVPFDLHVYQKGRHGIGLGTTPEPPGHAPAIRNTHPWVMDCRFWLKERGILPTALTLRISCLSNRRMIEGAKEQYAIEHKLPSGSTVTGEQISPYLKNGFEGFRCPSGGTYTIGKFGELARCTVHGEGGIP